MDLALSDEQQLIADSAARFLAERASSAATRAAMDSDAGIDRRLWQDMAELGWCGLHLPDEVGGLGLGAVELALLQEQLGRRLACVPFFDSTVLAATLLRDAADAASSARWLPQLASGECVATVAEGCGRAEWAAAAQTWQLQGRWPRAGSAGQADLLLLSARAPDDETLLFAVPAPAAGVTVEPQRTIDRTRRAAAVQVHALQLPPEACVARGPAAVAALARLRCLGAIALAAEQLGQAQQCLDMTVAYTQQRVQFDRPIASFQAVKHRCAQMMVGVESARSAVYGAACMADADPDTATLEFHAALAHCEASEAAQFCAQEAIQLHGGVGFTWEYDPHLYFKRAQVSSQRFGSTSHWLERVAAQLLD